MRTADHIGARQVGDGAGYPQHPRSTPPGKPEPVHRLSDQSHGIHGEMDGVAFDLRVACRSLRSVPVPYGQPGAQNTFGDHRTGLAARSMGKLDGRGWLDLHDQVNSVEHGTADAVAIVLAAAGSTATLSVGV